jgi:NDP-4-keto-2,6-dideoxyhexose 3-C-methyltransferase
MTWDQICHEHVTYYDLTTLKKIFLKAGFKILEVSFNEINGGSFNVICSKINSNLKPNKDKIDQIINSEKIFYMDKSLGSFAQRVKNSAKIIREFLNLLKMNKKIVVGYGASTKGNIILNYSKIDKKLLNCICDENPLKINKRVTPGTRINIISKEAMRKKKCDYLFVLIWSFRKEVIKQEVAFIKKGGKLIIPLPVLHIIDKSNYKDYLNRNLSDFAFKL